MGTISRIITNQSLWNATNELDIISKDNDVIFSSISKVSIDGSEQGHEIGNYDYKEADNPIIKDFPYGWWTYDFDGKKRVEHDKRNNTGFRSSLEKKVFFQLDVHDRIPIGTVIQFQLYDYDTGLFMDWVNPDDDEFGGKQIFRTAEVRELEGKKRITVELFLDPNWREDIVKDKGPFRDGCLDFYWKWTYENTDWNSEQVILHVYPSEIKLRVKPAINDHNYPLPEIYSHKGDLMVFAIGQLPDMKVEKFVSLKIRVSTKIDFYKDLDWIKKEIYTEVINLRNNTIESAHYTVEEANHFFKINEDITQYYVENKVTKVPVAKGSDIAYYNSVKKVLKYGKQAAEVFDKIQILDEMRNMIPELSNNGKFNMPSLSTFVGFVPALGPIAFGVAVMGWVAQDIINDMNEFIDEYAWKDWQKAKIQGLQAARSFAKNPWAKDKQGFQFESVSHSTLNSLLKGKFNKFEDLVLENSKDASQKTHTVFSYRIVDEELDTYYDIIDCIIINDENEKSTTLFGIGNF